jgi:hypothetical protein
MANGEPVASAAGFFVSKIHSNRAGLKLNFGYEGHSGRG